MSFIAHQITTTYKNDSGLIRSITNTYYGNQEVALEYEIPAVQTDRQVTVEFDVANIECLLLTCDKDITIKTNSSSVPDDELTLNANVPTAWRKDEIATCPFTADVETIYVTNAASAVATLILRVLINLD